MGMGSGNVRAKRERKFLVNYGPSPPPTPIHHPWWVLGEWVGGGWVAEAGAEVAAGAEVVAV